MSGELRIQKLLSHAGRASRREAERLIAEGRVRVNGRVVLDLGTRVVPGRDRVELDGEPVSVPAPTWIAFHKPPGVLTTRHDPHGGRTVYDVLPAEMASLRYVGRLDREAEGLLLFTNDGDAAHRLQHPRTEVEREYRVEVAGRVRLAELGRLRAGVELDDGLARARRTALVRAGPICSTIELVLTEGRKREVRRMLSAIGHPVLRLVRTRFGSVRLGDLAPCAWRPLEQSEVERLLA
jgi:pseudouridine synthase